MSSVSVADNWKRYTVHIILFLVTFFTATIAGVQWMNKDPFELANFSAGLTYSILIMLMLGSHEFGHYFAARSHGVPATLPFFIPFPSFFGINPFGTMGAVIRLRGEISSRRVLFDIGSAGPIAGFVVTTAILMYGFASLPSIEYLYAIHPEYAQGIEIPRAGIIFGDTLLYSLIGKLFAPANAFIPPMSEMYHYPFLCVGWFGLLVTAMNLIPVGQLDGGHISFALFGDTSYSIGKASLGILVVLGIGGLLPLLDLGVEFGWSGWLFWAMVLVVFLKVLKTRRPPLEYDEPLDTNRKILGWVCMFIFIGSFSITPFTILLPN